MRIAVLTNKFRWKEFADSFPLDQLMIKRNDYIEVDVIDHYYHWISNENALLGMTFDAIMILGACDKTLFELCQLYNGRGFYDVNEKIQKEYIK